MLARILTGFVFVVLLVLCIGAFSLYNGNNGEEVAVLIPRGAGVSKVAAVLEQEGVMHNAFLFKLLVTLTGGRGGVKAGEYSFKKDQGAVGALLTFYYSTPIEHTVTIPEGWNARQIAGILQAQKLAEPKKFLEIVFSPKSAAKYKLSSPTLEGYLFPDTYTFSRVDGEERIVDRMVQRFFSKTESLRGEIKSSGMTTEQWVTLASIIEKETGVPTERELISSVFHNRLKKKMRLQSDPTTIYGISDFDGNLTKKHLQTSTAYNTYTIPALPPGAIASPGFEALRATLHPAQTEYLYFVANNQGGHLFSATYAEHSQKVDQYQKRRATRNANSERQIGNIRR
ncbi:endolytic transglycosylase MltG [bacterium]|nr:endolytic transglycosylase MltG [bacterium]